MNKRPSASARTLAALALVAALVAAVVAIGAALDGGSDGGGEPKAVERRERQRPLPAVYVVESGDTLTAIARKTGLSVARIESLNPQVDPQILIAGEKLKLRASP